MELGGAYNKLIIKENNTRYMLKFSDEINFIDTPLYFTEYLSCKIVKELGINVQDVNLEIYKNQPCCKIKLFDYNIIQAYGLNKSTFDSNNIPRESLNNNRLELLFNLNSSKSDKFNISIDNLNKWIIELLLSDFITFNSDRHMGNIGLFKINNKYNLAPLYDFGNTFFIDKYNSIINNEIDYNFLIDNFKTQFRFKTKKMKVKELYNKYNILKDNGKYILDILDRAYCLNINNILENEIIITNIKSKYIKFIKEIYYKNIDSLFNIFNKDILDWD